MKSTTLVWTIIGIIVLVGIGWYALSLSSTPAAPVVTPTATTTGDTTGGTVTTGTAATGTATTTPPNTVGLGERCGGNMATAKSCSDGYHCAPQPGSHLPFGDVGGVCVSGAQ